MEKQSQRKRWKCVQNLSLSKGRREKRKERREEGRKERRKEGRKEGRKEKDKLNNRVNKNESLEWRKKKIERKMKTAQ